MLRGDGGRLQGDPPRSFRCGRRAETFASRLFRYLHVGASDEMIEKGSKMALLIVCWRQEGRVWLLKGCIWLQELWPRVLPDGHWHMLAPKISALLCWELPLLLALLLSDCFVPRSEGDVGGDDGGDVEITRYLPSVRCIFVCLILSCFDPALYRTMACSCCR